MLVSSNYLHSGHPNKRQSISVNSPRLLQGGVMLGLSLLSMWCPLELDYTSFPRCVYQFACVCQINSGFLFALLLSQLEHTGRRFFACPYSAAMQLCV